MDIRTASVSVLNDASYFLQKIASPAYAQAIPLLFDASIGSHTRHLIEFYQCLLRQANTGTINYCLRNRDTQLEQSPQAALRAIEMIIPHLDTLDLEQSVQLHTEKEHGAVLQSTVGRELYYNTEHAIHHLALIKVGLKAICPELVLPPHFGYAPSTLQYRRGSAQS